MQNLSSTIPRGWLAFELNILRRLKYQSAILPFTNEPNLGAYLKRWNTCVAANDLTQAGWTKAVAVIQNNSEFLADEDVQTVLEDAYVPRYRLQNEALKNWFNETDSWWFDNVRQNIDRITSPTARAIALSIGMSVGDYVLSFDQKTLELRQPLSTVYRRLWSVFPEPINNGETNTCQNKTANDFIAENRGNLMFLRLPRAYHNSLRNYLGWTAWREEWLRCGDDFWGDMEKAQFGKLGDFVETKTQYLQFVEETLERAGHISQWAIAHIEEGFISTQDIVETIGKVRTVDTIYTKDFTELTGTKAVIITA
ncbi:MAG: hypothetical protein R2747_16675 [Pyrinomonadaceae bacterium]